MPKAFLFTHKRYDLYNLNIPQPWRQQWAMAEADDDDGKKVYKLPPDELEEVKLHPPRLIPDSYCAKDGDDDQPVNLSVKKLDLFNLRQLAEVSISIVPDSTSADETQEKSNSDDNEPADSEVFEEQDCSVSLIVNDSTFHHQCIECGKAYSTLSNLLRHRQTHRSTSDSNAIKTCPFCDKIYVSMPAFSMHLRTHNQGCKCSYCGKLFSRPWLLQGHIRTHTGEKPFECPSCNKKFADKSNLRAHTQTHSTDKPYVCSRCSKKFGLKSYLSKHIESSCMKTNKTCTTGTNKSPKFYKRSQTNGGVNKNSVKSGAIAIAACTSSSSSSSNSSC